MRPRTGMFVVKPGDRKAWGKERVLRLISWLVG